MLTLDSTPGWFEAKEQGRVVRDSALLNLTTDIAGYEVTDMTLRQYLILRLTRNPLLYGETPTPVQLATFLWILNPNYNEQAIGRKVFLKTCDWNVSMPIFRTRRAMKRYELKRDKVFKRMGEVLAAAREYMAETMVDKPKSKSSSSEPDYYSEGVFWCALFGREIHQQWQNTLQMPMKIMFQFLSEIRQERGEKLSDAFLAPLISNRLQELNNGNNS